MVRWLGYCIENHMSNRYHANIVDQCLTDAGFILSNNWQIILLRCLNGDGHDDGGRSVILALDEFHFAQQLF
jgi:hypothetical protein